MNTLLEPTKEIQKPAVESMATRVALHPFLAGMNPTQLALLADCAIAVEFKKGQTILREGEMANRFYLIESGKVILESGEGFGDPVIIETIGAGDCLAGHGCFHFMSGISRRVRPNPLMRYSSTEQSSGNIASAIIRSATSCSSGSLLSCWNGCNQHVRPVMDRAGQK